MASGHPYKGHSENAVGHRRAKTVMQSGGYIPKRQSGGATRQPPKPLPLLEKPDPSRDLVRDVEALDRAVRPRLDKKARGGAVAKRQTGGGIHKITPSKHRPHFSVNVVNINRGRGRRGIGLPPPVPGGGVPPVPGGPPMPMQAGGPAMIDPVALAAARRMRKNKLAAAGAMAARANPSVMPAVGRGYAKGGKIGQTRKGKEAGQGTGAGRLEEANHMKGRYP